MKKIPSLILIALTVLSTTVFADDVQYITRAEATEKIVQYMFDLSYGEQSFDINMTYCMHEMRSMHFTLPFTEQGEGTCPLLASIYHAVGWNNFSDITANHENAIALNLAKEMGIVSGNGNDTFCPDEPITFGQTVKMLVCALGYDSRAYIDGGYPYGYIKVADEIGATKNVKLETDSLISVQEFEMLLKDFFELDNYPMKNVLIKMPVTAEEAVNIYAEGLKSRNARIQYAVFSDELQQNNRDDFEQMHWVTGVSSPWCTGYEIIKVNELKFSVTFFYTASDGPAGNTIMSLTAEQFGPVYKITAATQIYSN